MSNPLFPSITDSFDLNTGYTYTTNNTNITQPVYTINTTTGTNGTYNWASITNNETSHTLHVKGDANFEGDVKIKGKSINESLEKIEEKLAILHPNEELEAKWENLRGLRKAYMELEAEIKEKEEIWKILKK